MAQSANTSATQTRVVLACATFKGTLSSKGAGEALARGLQSAGIATQVVSLADGGEGLVDALSAQVDGALKVGVPSRCPLQKPRTATFAMLPALKSPPKKDTGVLRRVPTAIIEMAASSGLTLVPEGQRDPKIATSLGVGDQILAALEHQRDDLEIVLGIGGSATNDGGAGMAQALGAKLLDSKGREIEPGGAALIKLAHIDITDMNKRAQTVPVTVACDVNNPLCGPTGASHVFGKQKGGTPDDLKLLDEALANYARVIKKDLGRDVANVPGAGASGGLGAGCLAFLNAKLRPGIDLVLDVLNFDDVLDGAALVITGEGGLDDQTLMGKAPAGVAARAAKKGIKTMAIGGNIDRAHETALKKVFVRIESLSDFAGSPEAAMRETARFLENMAKAKAADWLK